MPNTDVDIHRIHHCLRAGKLLLELFKGTGSVGDAFAAHAWDIVSLDSDEQHKATLCIDIFDLDYHNLPVPDHIHASPDCATYSFAAHHAKHRIPANNVHAHGAGARVGAPLTPKAICADRVVDRVVEIILYFRSVHPGLTYTIENPRGYLRYHPALAKLHDATLHETSYNQFGAPIGKPTHIWTNVPIVLPSAVRMRGDIKIDDAHHAQLRRALSDFYGLSRDTSVKVLCGSLPRGLVLRFVDAVETHWRSDVMKWECAFCGATNESGYRCSNPRCNLKRSCAQYNRRSTKRRIQPVESVECNLSDDDFDVIDMLDFESDESSD